MKQGLLNVSALVSALILAVQAYGFIGRFGPQFQRTVTGGSKTDYQELSITLEEGRAKAWLQVWSPAPKGTAGRRIKWLGGIWPPRAPDVRRAIWEFDAHPLAVTAGSRAFIVACPIWCLAVPFLIAPSIWIRNRRRKQKIGFPL
jgi:hypothetical protein